MEIIIANKQILIVEDNPISAKLIEVMVNQTFKKSGLVISIDIAKEEKEAVKLIEKIDYCLITLGGKLANGGHGKNVLKEIYQRFRKKIIVISTDVDFGNFCRENYMLFFDRGNLTSIEDKLVLAMKTIISHHDAKEKAVP